MSNINEMMDAVRKAAEEAFEEHLEYLAVWKERRWGKSKIVVELTREVALYMLDAMTRAALQYGATLNLETFLESTSSRVIIKAVLVLQYNGIEIKRFGSGEAEHERRLKDGKVESDPYAARAAETRAIKRALESFVPQVGSKLIRITEWLTSWANRNPQMAKEDDEEYAKRALKTMVELYRQKKQQQT